MEIRQNFSLKNLNTFGVEAFARYYAAFKEEESLAELLHHFRELPQLILGGGSNVLFTQDFPGVVLHNQIEGIERLKEDESGVYLRVGAGENWHRFVLHCIERDWAGIENLSLIPGTVGASPMQNIGAYGVEVKEVIEEVEAIHRRSGEKRVFSREACAFGYRDSIFKQGEKEQWVITRVGFRLSKHPQFRVGYGAIQEKLEEKGIHTLSIQAISQVVCEIRQSKLPDPAQIGNGGSFFKNPVISQADFLALQEQYPHIVGYPIDSEKTKVPAAWLIDQDGWKGHRKGAVGVHKNQALVLVNYGPGKGGEVWQLAQEIQESVHKRFGIRLSPEINLI